MRTARLIGSALVVVSLAAAPAAAQDLMPQCNGARSARLSVGPTVNSAPSFKERFGGAVEAAACATGANELLGLTGWHGLALGGRYLLADPDVVTAEVSEVHAKVLYGFSMGDDELDIGSVENPTRAAGTRSWGWLEFGGQGSYEESVDRSERGLAGGAVLRYGHERHAFIPVVSVRYEIVRSTHSDARRAAGEDEKDVHERLGVDLYLNYGLRFVSEALEAFRVGGDFSYFRSYGVDSALANADADWESGIFGAGMIRWNGDVGLFGGLSIADIYLRYAGGHKGLDPDDEDGFRLGIDLAWSAGSGP